MKGKDLIEFIKSHNFEDYEFYCNFADDYRCEMPICKDSVKIDEKAKIIIFDSY